jgi:hypothetical protein
MNEVQRCKSCAQAKPKFISVVPVTNDVIRIDALVFRRPARGAAAKRGSGAAENISMSESNGATTGAKRQKVEPAGKAKPAAGPTRAGRRRQQSSETDENVEQEEAEEEMEEEPGDSGDDAPSAPAAGYDYLLHSHLFCR